MCDLIRNSIDLRCAEACPALKRTVEEEANYTRVIQQEASMKQMFKCTCAALVCALALGCASSTQLTAVWSDPDFSGTSTAKIMALGLGATEIGTRLFEDAMANQLATHKTTVYKGSNAFPINAPIDSSALHQYIIDNQIDLLSVTRLVDVSTRSEYVPGTTTYVPVAGYRNFYTYYPESFSGVQEPGYVATFRTATVETNVYSAATGGLVWSGLSHTIDPISLDVAVNDIAKALVNDMAARGLFGPTK